MCYPFNMETWKQYLLPQYEISTLGRIRSMETKRGPRPAPLILKQRQSESNYASVALWDGTQIRHKRVHVMLLETFVGPKPTPQHVTRHLDGDRTNNTLDNLKWGTLSENAADTRRHRGITDGEQYAAVLMYLRGVPAEVLASALNVSRATICNWARKPLGS